MCLTSSGQVAGMAKRCPQSPTDVIFVALGALDFGIYEDDLIVGRDVAVVSLRVRSELSQSADCQPERSRASFGQHASQAEEEDEIVQVLDDCFHLAVPLLFIFKCLLLLGFVPGFQLRE